MNSQAKELCEELDEVLEIVEDVVDEKGEQIGKIVGKLIATYGASVMEEIVKSKFSDNAAALQAHYVCMLIAGIRDHGHDEATAVELAKAALKS